MTGGEFAFFIFAAVAVLSAAAMVFSTRNPVVAAVWLVLSFVSKHRSYNNITDGIYRGHRCLKVIIDRDTTTSVSVDSDSRQVKRVCKRCMAC